MSDEIRDQINDIIEGEIQNNINEYLESQKGKQDSGLGFANNEGTQLNVKVSHEEIDKIVSFATHRNMHFALMHCVSIYPTPAEESNLIRIKILKERFPNVSIGWSTHEDPNDLNPIKIAYGYGASLYERHIGVNTKKYKLNLYSSTPSQIDEWFKAYKKIVVYSGKYYDKVNKTEFEGKTN